MLHLLFPSRPSFTIIRRIPSQPSKSIKLNLKRETVSADIPIDYSLTQGRWFANVTIGGQDLELLVDTGSGRLVSNAIRQYDDSAYLLNFPVYVVGRMLPLQPQDCITGRSVPPMISSKERTRYLLQRK